MDMAGHARDASAVQSRTELRKLDFLLLSRMLFYQSPEFSRPLGPSRIILRHLLQCVEVNLDVSMLAVEMLGLMFGSRLLVQQRIDHVFLRHGMGGKPTLQPEQKVGSIKV